VRALAAGPGVAFDPAPGRVFVVDPGGLVAEVELATLAVAYHSVGPALSPLARAEACESRWRTARWLGDGLIAVSGFDRHEFTTTDGSRLRTRTEMKGPAPG